MSLEPSSPVRTGRAHSARPGADLPIRVIHEIRETSRTRDQIDGCAPTLSRARTALPRSRDQAGNDCRVPTRPAPARVLSDPTRDDVIASVPLRGSGVWRAKSFVSRSVSTRGRVVVSMVLWATRATR